MSGGIDRRAFVKGAALTLAAPGLLSLLSGCGTAPDLDAALSDFHDDAGAAAVIGSAYLEVTPEERDRGLLLERLAGASLAAWDQLAVRDRAALAEAVRERHRADFAQDRVVRLNGWILSRTEARLCALVAGPQDA